MKRRKRLLKNFGLVINDAGQSRATFFAGELVSFIRMIPRAGCRPFPKSLLLRSFSKGQGFYSEDLFCI